MKISRICQARNGLGGGKIGMRVPQLLPRATIRPGRAQGGEHSHQMQVDNFGYGKISIDGESANQVYRDAMNLRAWRKSQKLMLKHLAPIFGASIATISELERGAQNVSRETIARIEGATGGQVTAADLHATFKAANRAAYDFHRAAGRDAMAQFRKTAKPRKQEI